MKKRKQKEFIEFVLKKYPPKNNVKTKDFIKINNLSKVIEQILPKYNPNNHKDRYDSIIYNEIYNLLGKMKQQLFKKNI